VAEIIRLEEIRHARARRRAHALTARCLTLMERALATCRLAYYEASLEERGAWATKIRQLEELIEYTAHLG